MYKKTFSTLVNCVLSFRVDHKRSGAIGIFCCFVKSNR